jgi:ligand-binding sensor domain-containing protein
MPAATARLRAVALCGLLLLGTAAGALEPAEGSGPLVLAPVPLYGADVRSLVFDPREPDRAFAGTSAGHVYRSDDGGESWREASVGPVPFPGWVVGSLRFDPNRPERLWAALWGIWGGGLVAYSDDLGATWTFRSDGLPPGDQVYALAHVPGIPGRLFAATRTGVWRTDDDGVAWSRASASEPRLIHVSSLLVDGADPNRILAGTWRRAFRSDDGGATWREAPDGMVLDSEVFTLNPVPGRPGELWASTCGWIYRGEDFGRRWTRVTEGFRERRTPSFLVVSPERLLAGTVAGLHLSTDGGRSFRRTSDGRLPILALAHHPARPERVLIGTEGAGVWLSTDGGETLAPRLTATANVRVPALAATGGSVFAAVAHAGPLSGVYRSPDRGVSFEPSAAELPTVLDLQVDGDRLWAATERGLYERSGAEWRRVGELADSRVEQLLASGDRRLVRTVDGLWERAADGRYRRLETGARGAPIGAAFAWGELWLRTSEGLWRLRGEGAAEAASLPSADATPVVSGAGELLLDCHDGLWRRADPAAEWQRLSPGPLRALPTRDARFPLLVAGSDGLALYSPADGRRLAVGASFPPGTVSSALLDGSRLWVGTSGYGLWTAEIAPAPPAEAEAATAVAGSAAGAR